MLYPLLLCYYFAMSPVTDHSIAFKNGAVISFIPLTRQWISMNPSAASPSPILSSRPRQALLATMVLLALLLISCGQRQEPPAAVNPAVPAKAADHMQAHWIETGDLSAIAQHGILRILVHKGQESQLPRRNYPIDAKQKWLLRFAEQQGLSARIVTVATSEDLIPAL